MVALTGSLQITSQDLYRQFLLKYGHPDTTGRAPRRRFRSGYFHPADCYETLVAKLVTDQTHWIDIGGGSALFPDNRALSDLLASRARRLVIVDPSANLDGNPHGHERVKSAIDAYRSDEPFDLATLRMVAEHITDPGALLDALNRLVRSGGLVVVFTVNRWSLVTMAAAVAPFACHHRIKRWFWDGEAKDTFPTAYRMNTRGRLRSLFTQHGFEELQFLYLDDLSVFAGFERLSRLELGAWRLFKRLRLRYPENCLLGTYRRA
jgi:SAM-dependent methyltransferase